MSKENYYCIGDLHGRFDLLTKALNHIYKAEPDGCKIIFLGDYIDRGPQSGMVVKTVMEGKEGYDFVCLKGNHEDMLVGVDKGENGVYDGLAAVDLMATLDKSVFLPWMENLPVFHIVDKNVFAHAYFDDRVSLENQNPHMCMWHRMGRSEFYDNSCHGFTLIHGHTPNVNGPIASANRWNFDTGAFHTGRLCVGVFERGVAGPVDIVEILE